MPKLTDDRQPAMERLQRLVTARGLMGVALSTHYGDPALKVRGKALATVKEASLLVLHCPLEMKEMLMEMAPDIYFETDHYRGWPAVLVRLDAVGDEELGLRLENAWRERAETPH